MKKKKITCEIDEILYQKIKMYCVIEKVPLYKIVTEAFEKKINKLTKQKEPDVCQKVCNDSRCTG